MFSNMNEVKQANKYLGHHFFSPDTMKFFASKIESELYDNQCFITSEKKCFNDYNREYNVRQAREDGSIESIKRGFSSVKEAERFILKEFEG
jgi:hypothetical protein